jgi:Domain of unknown function (DUF4390)
MRSAVSAHPVSRPRAWQRGRRAVAVLFQLLLLLSLWAMPAARAADPQLAAFEVVHNDEGVLLTYAVNGDLARSVDDALSKAVPLYFVAEAELFRDRWYWRDLRVANAVRVWRIVYQPLTSTYRVTFGGLSQNYNSREEAFAAISRTSRWKIAEPGQVADGNRHYVEFSYRLDTSLLPRPMQIGIGGQADWNYSVQRVQRIN